MATQEIGASDSTVAQLLELAARVADHATSELKLFKQGFNPTAASTLAEFDAEEADFDGYAAAVVGPFSTAGVDADGGVVSYSANAVFQKTAGANTNVIAGAYLVQQGTPDTLAAFWKFPQVIPVSATGTTIQAVVALREPGIDSIVVSD